ncbi:MAG: methyltransferase [Acidimicrobiales bacterium]|nr:methyltransferase [Acidimicrobiales bacterium]
MALLTLPGVFSPISDSWMLAAALQREPIGPGARVLDVCTGSGVLALDAAQTGAHVTAVDVSRRAVWTVCLNARRHRLPVRARRGRCFEAVAEERFDLIVSNPPYVPSPNPDLPTRGPSRAWAAGRDGRVVLDQLCDEAPYHLRPGGAILIVHSSLIGEDATVERLRGAGLIDVRVVERHTGPLGPLMREQQEAGTVPSDVDEEDVVIVRGAAPRL